MNGDEADHVANIFKSDELPFKLKIVETQIIKGNKFQPIIASYFDKIHIVKV
jgi:hypothetical protein